MKRQPSNGVAGALFLIGLGVLIFTGWWWPGIMVVLGTAIGLGLITEGKFFTGLVAAGIFFAIPFLAELHLRWEVIGPMILIGLGVIALAKAVLFRHA